MMKLGRKKLTSTVLIFLFSTLLALASVVGIVALFSAKSTIAISIIGVVLLLSALYVSGNPRVFCLWGLILAAPLSLAKKFYPIPHMGGAGSYDLELTDIFILGLLFFIFRDIRWGHIRRIRWGRATFYWGGMMALGVFSILAGPFRHLPAQEVFRMLKLFLMFLVLINELVRVKQFMHALGALVAGVAIESVIGIIQYVFKTDLHLQALGEATLETIQNVTRVTFLQTGGAFRIGGLIGHPNLLAAYLALILPICVAALFGKIKTAYKVIIGITVVLGGITLVLTLSRAGWIAFALAMVTLMLLSFYHFRMRRKFLLFKFVLIGSALIMAGVFSGPIIKRITESHPGAVDFRVEWNQLAWTMIKAKPVLGFGLNTFVFHMIPYSKYKTLENMQDKIGEVLPVVHNIYLLVWAEQGTIGFLFFIGLHLHVLVLGMKNNRYYEEKILYVMNLGCISGFLAIMADGMGSFFMRNAQCGRVFWIVIALVTAINYWYRENNRAPRNIPRPQTVMDRPRPRTLAPVGARVEKVDPLKLTL